MKSPLFTLLVFVAFFSTTFGQLPSEFAKPCKNYSPWVYWFWNNGNLTLEGIDADLEAMHRVGIGGVLILEVGEGAPRGPVDYMSDRWREMFSYMLAKAASLNIDVNVYNGPGWSGSGGPWIKPEDAMKVLTFQIVEVSAENRPEKIVFPPGVRTFGYYKDICVLVFPTPEVKIEDGFLHVDNQRLKTPAHQHPAEAFIPLDAIVDLSDMMNDAGEISGQIPSGNMTLIRFGVTCKQMHAHPTPASIGGVPECDRLSKRGIEAAFNGKIGKLLADNKEHVGKTFVATHIDSWENGSQTWTDDMREEFLERRKYDLWKFLPIFAGYVMENPEYTERFLWDFRRTVSELVLDNYAGQMKALAEENGLRFTVEAYYNTPCDNLQYGGIADEPMGEFWYSRMMFHTCRGMASAGHIYGKNIIGAESFTANNLERWLAHPGSIKTLGDLAFSEGINRFVFHRYSFQPWKDVRPGMMMGSWGTHFERTQTWWELTPAWHSYLSRCHYMLRQGQFVADILYLEPEDSPQMFTDHPRNGFQWDQGNTDVVLKAGVEDGMLMLASGMKYRLMVLPQTDRMTPELLEKTLQLVRDGLTVIGEHPATAAPGLTNYPNNDSRVKGLAQQLWGDVATQENDRVAVRKIALFRNQSPAPWGEMRTTSGEHLVGKGKIVWGKTPEAVLSEMNVVPVFVSNARLNWTHRQLPDTEIFFVANPRHQAVFANIQIRGHGKPELWHPETGKTVPVTSFHTDSKTTRLTIALGATESMFIILRKSESGVESVSNRNVLLSMSRDGKQIFDLAKPVGKITVISAKYGNPIDPAKMIDVKPLIEKFVDSGERRIIVSRMNQQQDATVVNTVKTLVIEYEMNGKHYMVKGKDGESLILGNILPKVKVLNAKYDRWNAEKQVIDIQERLQRYFDRGENNFPSSWLEQADDPEPIRFASLMFEYETNDKTGAWHGISWNGTDGVAISIDEKTEPVVVVPVSDNEGKPCIDFYESGKYELTFASNKKRTETVSLPEPMNLNDNWSVAFPHKTVKFDQLISWSESADDSVRFFSGTATYTKTFIIPKNFLKKDMRITLDLGQAEVMAQVELNGKDLGVLWKIEKNVDITDYLKSGENHLKISVTNLWPNRLIGEAALPTSDERNENGTLKEWPQWLLDGKPDPSGRSTFCMINLWKADEELIPSGLIGPVRITPVKRIIMK